MSDDQWTVRINGKEVPKGPSETGEFGVSKAELKHIIFGQVSAIRDEPMTHRGLFHKVCAHMQIECTPEKEEAMLRTFMELLHQLRDERRVVFRLGDTATYVELA